MRGNLNNWVTNITITYSDGGNEFTNYVDPKTKDVYLTANTDGNSIAEIEFYPDILAKFLRINIMNSHNLPCMALEGYYRG